MTVECECGESYLVESDAFNDGGVYYYFEFLAARIKGV